MKYFTSIVEIARSDKLWRSSNGVKWKGLRCVLWCSCGKKSWSTLFIIQLCVFLPPKHSLIGYKCCKLTLVTRTRREDGCHFVLKNQLESSCITRSVLCVWLLLFSRDNDDFSIFLLWGYVFGLSLVRCCNVVKNRTWNGLSKFGFAC